MFYGSQQISFWFLAPVSPIWVTLGFFFGWVPSTLRFPPWLFGAMAWLLRHNVTIAISPPPLLTMTYATVGLLMMSKQTQKHNNGYDVCTIASIHIFIASNWKETFQRQEQETTLCHNCCTILVSESHHNNVNIYYVLQCCNGYENKGVFGNRIGSRGIHRRAPHQKHMPTITSHGMLHIYTHIVNNAHVHDCACQHAHALRMHQHAHIFWSSKDIDDLCCGISTYRRLSGHCQETNIFKPFPKQSCLHILL